jgi:hypothetical protein
MQELEKVAEDGGELRRPRAELGSSATEEEVVEEEEPKRFIVA